VRRNACPGLQSRLTGLLVLLAAAWLCGFAMLPSAHAAASHQDQLPTSAAIRFEHLSIEQGLSQSTVTTILQDQYGFMWFGTDDGLNRYDGYEFKVLRHNPDDPASLSQGGIREIYEDHAGSLWIRTSSGGFDRYDRNRNQFIHYRRADGGIDPQPEDFVWDLYEDRTGTIWVGTYLSGLYRYDRASDRFVQYRHSEANRESLSDDRVYAICEDRAGQLWIGTAKGLDRLDRNLGRFAHFTHDSNDPATLAGERVQLIQEDAGGRLWVATYGTGLNLFDPASGHVTRYTHDPQNLQSIDETTRILQIYEDRRGYIWVLHADGRLDRFDPMQGVFKRFRADPAAPGAGPTTPFSTELLANSHVSFVQEDSRGNLWVGTYGGLDLYDQVRESFTHYRHSPYDENSLSDNELLSFYEDRGGGLWIGTYGHGLNHFDPSQLRFPRYRIDPQAADAAENNLVLDVREGRNGLLWVATAAGLSSLDRATGQVTRYRHDPDNPASLSAGHVWSVFEDQEGRVWVGTDDSLDLLDPASAGFRHYRNTNGDANAPYGIVTAIQDDGSGGLWLGVYGRGLEHFDPAGEQFKTYEYYLQPVEGNVSTHRGVWAVYPDRNGFLWIGTTQGLYRLDAKTGAVDRFENDPLDPASLSSNEIHSIWEDRAGRLWFGTWQGGINQFDQATGKFTRYTVKDGLPNNTIYCILEDGSGALWLSTNNGLSRFDPAATLLAATSRVVGRFRNYDVGDGLQSNEFNTGSCSSSSEGEFFFGGVNGFNAFFPDRITDSAGVSPVVLASLTREGQNLSPNQAVEGLRALTLLWPENSFEFEFATLSYAQPGKNLYAYMLTPFETTWTEVGNRRFGSYTNLPGGQYTLHMKGANNAGVWNEEGAQLQITVIPPFWQTWPFRGALLLVAALLAAGAYRWRVASIENRSRQLAVDVAERTMTIAQQTADLEALYQADERLERQVQLDDVLQALVDIAVDLLDADKSAVLAWDDDRGQEGRRLVIRVARNFGPEAISQITFEPGEGFVGRAMAAGELITVEDAETELQHVPERAAVVAAVLSEGIRSFMHIPIRFDGQIFGVFTVCYEETRAFGVREQRLFSALAQRAALGVQKAQYLAAEQRRAEQFRVISEMGRALASILDIDSLLSEIVRLIHLAFGYDHVGVALIEGDSAVYRVGAGKIWEDPAFEFTPNHLKIWPGGAGPGGAPGEGITGWVAGTGEALLVPDVSQEPRYVHLRGSGTRSELAVPLKVAGKVIGVLDAQSQRLNAFDESDLTVMQSLANQAAVAIENARLYDNMGKHVAQLTALQETNRAVASTLDRDALLKLIMEQATALLQAQGGMINLVDWEKREDRVVACSGAARQFYGARSRLDHSLSGWVTLHNRAVISNQVDEDDRMAPEARVWLAETAIRSVALAPLTVKDQVAGTLVLLKDRGKGGFDDSDLDLLVPFADQAAIAIENARLYEEAQQLAASQERSRLARDLHDAVTQTLFSASLIAEVLPTLWESDQAEGRQLLAELRQLTRGALAEMRTLLLELRPIALIEADLGDLLRQLAESVSGRSGIPVTVSTQSSLVPKGAAPDLPDEVHIALYRIAQEALNNIVKHARAKHADVGLRVSSACEDGEEELAPARQFRIELWISDDGCGFDPATVSPNHLGLGIIRERSQAIGAALRIASQPGTGTVVEVAWNSGRKNVSDAD
jgi:ligand-binding sensor domain-containing protein/GAF domain-containing protein